MVFFSCSSVKARKKKRRKMRGVSLVFLFSISLLCLVSSERISLDFEKNVEVALNENRMVGHGVSVNPSLVKILGESREKKRQEEEDDTPFCDDQEKFSVVETAFDAPIKSFLWSSYKSENVWIITEDGGFFFFFFIFYFFFFFVFIYLIF